MGKMNYSLVLRRNPAKKDEPKKYYASAQTTGVFTFQQLSERIADRSTASIADVSLVIKNLLKVMTDELQNGNTVLVDDIVLSVWAFRARAWPKYRLQHRYDQKGACGVLSVGSTESVLHRFAVRHDYHAGGTGKGLEGCQGGNKSCR